MTDKKKIHKKVDDSANIKSGIFVERRRMPFTAVLVLLILIGIGIYFAFPLIRGNLPNSADSEPLDVEVGPQLQVKDIEPSINSDVLINITTAVEKLSEQVLSLEKRLTEEKLRQEETVSQQEKVDPKSVTPDNRQLNSAFMAELMGREDRGIKSRVEIIEKQLSEFSQEQNKINSLSLAQQQLSSRITQFSQELEAFIKRSQSERTNLILILAYAELSHALSMSKIYHAEIEKLILSVPPDLLSDPTFKEALATISSYSQSGVPTVSELDATFDDMAREIMRAHAAAEDEGWVEATIGRLRQVITVRRVSGEIAPDSIEGKLVSLKHNLNIGDLATALAISKTFPRDTQGLAQKWFDGIKGRILVKQALNKIGKQIFERIVQRVE